jgi:uncharacterized membrane protein YecN with MAPEG domain
MTLAITPIYGVLLTVLLLILSARVIMERRGNQFAYGNNDSNRIEAKIRAQANWAEYVPIALLLLMMAEIQGVGAFWLHLTGIILLVGRVAHGYGMSFNPKDFRFRFYGMILTITAIPLAMILNVIALI